MKKRSYLVVCMIIVVVASYGFISANKQQTKTPSTELHWLTFQQALKLNKKHPKKMFIDVYTKWCMWCKRMDVTTYKNPVIIKDLNKYFYPVKLDAETTDTIVFQDTVKFVNPHPNQRGSVNQLAYSLLDGKLEYPTTVYLASNYKRLSIAPGYHTAKEMEAILIYFGKDYYKKESWKNFQSTFKGEIK